MGKIYTGIDIGSSRIKFAVCESGGQVRRTAVVPIPERLVQEGRITAPAAMSEVLRAAAKEQKLKNKSCALILPASAAFCRRFTVPMMTVDQLRLNLPHEFRDFIARERDKYVYDYAVAGTARNADGQEELDLMGAAALKSAVSDLSVMLRRAGFSLRIAAPVEFAYCNLLRRYEAEEPAETPREYCIIDLGHSATRVHIFTGSRFEVTRVIEYGGAALDAAIADELHVDEYIAGTYKITNHGDVQSLERCRNLYHSIALEIMRAVNYYSFNNPDSRLSDAYYCGGGAKVKLLLESISSTVGLKLHSIGELMPGSREDGDEPLLYPAAVGITQQ